MTDLRGILWDLDGVLVDSGPYHLPAWQQAFSEVGIRLSESQFRQTFGMNNAGIIQSIMGTNTSTALARAIGERKEELFRDMVRGRVQALPGVLLWLQRFQASDMRQAVASSAPEANIALLLEELAVGSYFDAVVSGAEMPGKPEPDVFLAAAKRINLAPDACLVVEDAIAGIEGAIRAGMRCIAVTTTHPAAALSQADLVVDSLVDLPLDVLSLL